MKILTKKSRGKKAINAEIVIVLFFCGYSALHRSRMDAKIAYHKETEEPQALGRFLAEAVRWKYVDKY